MTAFAMFHAASKRTGEKSFNLEVFAGIHHAVSDGRIRRQGKPVRLIVDVERGPVNLDRELRTVEIET